ncbi:MAG: sulfite exporter TauE/SafE family protein [Rickettsiaceae bacterium]|nr:sulfite exporter TauE/SafE family protein [Rickettsiaceae bacterium]MDP5083042.1 sulfite exporter TauE/SafE family protein [Rickettsiaceae bacterium]
MLIVGYILALIMGMTLGLMGAGGSILTMPILVYFLNVPPVTATGYSLLIVGITALVGAARYYKKDQINVRTALMFAVPAFIAAYTTRRFMVPAIPIEIILYKNITITKDTFIMLIFATLMLLSGALMIKNNKPKPYIVKSKLKLITYIGLEGFFIGILTATVGAGGGFLIIPALVLLAGLEMKIAIGSSLLIITLNSLIGFIGDLQSGINIDYILLTTFLACSIFGLIIGSKLSSHFSSEKLKKIFGYFTLFVGIIVMIKEV